MLCKLEKNVTYIEDVSRTVNVADVIKFQRFHQLKHKLETLIFILFLYLFILYMFILFLYLFILYMFIFI